MVLLLFQSCSFSEAAPFPKLLLLQSCSFSKVAPFSKLLLFQSSYHLIVGSSKGQDLVRGVATVLTDLWARHAHSPRLATPTLRTAEVLLSQTQILSSPDDQAKLLGASITCINLAEIARRCSWRYNAATCVSVLLVNNMAKCMLVMTSPLRD